MTEAITIRTGDPAALAEEMADIAARNLAPEDRAWFQWFRNNEAAYHDGKKMARLPFDAAAIANAVRALDKLVEQPGRSRQLGVEKADLAHAIDALEVALEAHEPEAAALLREDRCARWWEGK